MVYDYWFQIKLRTMNLLNQDMDDWGCIENGNFTRVVGLMYFGQWCNLRKRSWQKEEEAQDIVKRKLSFELVQSWRCWERCCLIVVFILMNTYTSVYIYLIKDRHRKLQKWLRFEQKPLEGRVKSRLEVFDANVVDMDTWTGKISFLFKDPHRFPVSQKVHMKANTLF